VLQQILGIETGGSATKMVFCAKLIDFIATDCGDTLQRSRYM
jgi:hypothetical protein